MELLIMTLVSEAEELYLSKECKEEVIKASVKKTLLEGLKQQKISNTEYENALDILEKYKLS